SQRDRSSRLEAGIHGVAHEVDEELLDLIAVRRKTELGAREDAHAQSRLEPCDAANESTEVERLQARRREPRHLRIGFHETAERAGPRLDHRETAPGVLLPVLGEWAACEEPLEGSGDRMNRGQRVVQLVSKDADEPLPGLVLLLA